ncbi:hypothetical protein C8R43DRAFT_1109928 [Mycena crocata]|nr:hypothetical protein C8R43DRAFT_1109928 [Mycena crocata]
MTELIESCLSKDLPSMVDQTLDRLGYFEARWSFLAEHQIRFAIATKNVFDIWSDAGHEGATTMLLSIASLGLFDVYRPSAPFRDWYTWESQGWWPPVAWLDNAEARSLVKETFTTYLGKLHSEHADVSKRFQEIATNLDVLHPEL